MLQLANLIAYTIFRRYERSNTWLDDRIIDKFDVVDGVIHGLCHLHKGHISCKCLHVCRVTSYNEQFRNLSESK
jgi:hypothetical protein